MAIKLKLLVVFIIIGIVSTAQSLSDNNYRIYSVKLGKEVDVTAIINEINTCDIIIYGEEHNDSVTHFLEKTIFESLFQQCGQQLTLSLEMFDRDVQIVMDEYLAGFIREKNFTKDARAWSNYRDYKPMVELAREHELDVICANAAGRYTNLAGRNGSKALKDLPKASKAFFAPLPYDTAMGGYYKKLMGLSHQPSSSKNDTVKAKMPVMMMGSFNLNAAQSLWDATMAYSISAYHKKNKDKKIMQINGRFHSDEGFGLAAQLKKYSPKMKQIIISAGPDDSFPVIDWDQHKHLGDYVIITDPKVPKTFKSGIQ